MQGPDSCGWEPFSKSKPATAYLERGFKGRDSLHYYTLQVLDGSAHIQNIYFFGPKQFRVDVKLSQ